MKWKPIDERLMHAKIFHNTALSISVVVVYSPTNESAEEAKEAFLEQLQSVVNNIPKHDVLLITGDFKAKVGTNNEGHESAMGKHGIGKRKDNGKQLLDSSITGLDGWGISSFSRNLFLA
jgi:exonuclease III